MSAGLRERLHSVDPPQADAAERRAWELAAAAHADRAPAVHRVRGLRPAIVAAVLALTVTAVFTPAGAAVSDWVSEVVRFGRDDARPAVGPLPTAGRLLVSSAAGAWVVRRDGGSRRLGAYAEAGWSPRGLYVVGARGRRLVAMEPDGTVRWTISAAAPVRHPAWSLGYGYRIAYLSGGELRVVAGDGTGDRAVDRAAADVRPAWRPGSDRHVVAYGRPGGRVALADADAGDARPLRSAQGIAPSALEWTRSGRRLVAMAPGYVWVLDARLRNRGRTPMPAGTTAAAMAVHPGGRSVAVIRRTGRRSEVVSIPLRGPGNARTLFAGPGTFTDLAWSPDGRWLLVAWREADQWLFIRSDRGRRVEAAEGVRRHFDPGGDGPGTFPRIGGWCC